MRCTANNKGVALVTSIVLTLIALIVIMGILYMVTQSTTSSASRKVYRNAVEATYGGADFMMQEVIPKLLDPTNPKSLSEIQSFYNPLLTNLIPTVTNDTCMAQKLNTAPGANWAAWNNCPGNSMSPLDNPDIKLELKGVDSKFTVYSKIVDTSPGTEYPEQPPGGLPLLGGGVVEIGGLTSKAKHYVFRIEVAGERSNTKNKEQGRLTVVYEY